MADSIKVFNTHIEIYPYIRDDYPQIQMAFTATDKFKQEDFDCGFLIKDETLYIPRGYPVSKLEMMTGIHPEYVTEDDPFDSMDREHRSYFELRNELQEESCEFLTKSNNKQLALNLKMGFGKAEPLFRKIPTPTKQGWTRMGDLKIGDFVFGKNGKPTKIINVFDQPVQDIYKISFNDGRYALCAKDHLWNIKSYKEGKYRTNTTEMIYDDFIRLKKMHESKLSGKNFFFDRYIPICDPIEYESSPVPIHPYVIGSLIGNGCLLEPTLSISCKNDIIPKKIASLCNFKYKKNSDKNYTYSFYQNDSPVRTRDFFKDIPELIGSRSHNKSIPNIYLYNECNVRLELLRGLMDTDGSIHNGKDNKRYQVTYSSTSKKLLHQIIQILYSFGFSGNIADDRRTDTYKNGYCGYIYFRIPNSFKSTIFTDPDKVAISLKAKAVDQYNYFNDLRIENIEIVMKDKCRCIMVDNKDHLYLTEDFIVTHNTFVSIYAACKLNERMIIICPNDGIKQQWIATCKKMFDFKTKEGLDIVGSNIMDYLLDDVYTELPDIYFVNHQTLHSFMSSRGINKFKEFFQKIRVGIKIYDEAHLNFANILLIDFFSNTKRTWYLTATHGRSDKSEEKCFRLAFKSIDSYGERESDLVQRRHVIYHVVYTRSGLDNRGLRKVLAYPGLTAGSYGRWELMDDPNETTYGAIKKIIELTKNVEGKMLIFVPLIEIIEKLSKQLRLDFPEYEVGEYHSKMDKSEKESSLKKDIIISTIKSVGTGKDIPRLRKIICTEIFASKIIAKQVMGRLREYAPDKDTYYFDLGIDQSIPPAIFWFKGRFKAFASMAKEVVYLDLET